MISKTRSKKSHACVSLSGQQSKLKIDRYENYEGSFSRDFFEINDGQFG